MGYMTHFRFVNVSDELKKILDIAKKIFNEKEWGIIDVLKDTEGAECKWYDWEDDLVKLSSTNELKDVEIFLRGVGEITCDIWEARALNGEVVVKRAKVTLPKWKNRKLPVWDLEYCEASD